MLSRIELVGFKSFEEANVSLGGLTVLVGANASGKSNVLDAIRFLQGIAFGYTLAEALGGRWEGGRQVWPGVRGGAAEIVRKGSAEMIIGSTWTTGDVALSHRFACEVREQPRLTRETLVSGEPGEVLLDTNQMTRMKDDFLAADNRARDEMKGRRVYSGARSILFQPNAPMSTPQGLSPARDLLAGALRGAIFLDLDPSRMRDYVPETVDSLGLQGENVSALTWQICQDEDARRDLVDWLTELCAPELEDIAFATTELGDVMIVFVERGGRRIPARSLSDGTLRFLGELIALKTAPPGSLLLIEEIENGLHPTRAHLLVEAMEAATRTRGVQVIATTHSPMVLNALSPEALRQAVLVARPPGSEGSVLQRLGDLPDFDAVCERRGVDRMLASGWLERAL